MKSLLLALFLTAPSVTVAAYDVDAGVIDIIEVEAKKDHQALQISFGEKKGNKFCNDPAAQFVDNAYLASTSDNYDAILSVALSAYMAGSKVSIYTEYDPSEGHRCIIKKIRLL